MRQSRVGLARVLAIIPLLMLAVACASVRTDQRAEDARYGLFFTRAKHVSQLLQTGDVEKASRVWEREAAYFKESTDDTDKACTRNLADALEKLLAPLLAEKEAQLRSVKWPDTKEKWPGIKRLLAEVHKAIEDVDAHEVLRYLGRTDGLTRGVTATRDELTERIRMTAVESFLSDRPEEKPGFFSEYPVTIDARKLVRDTKPRWVGMLSNAPAEKAAKFADCYRDFLTKNDLEDIAEIYFRKMLDQGAGRKAAFAPVLDAVRKTKDAGLPTANLKIAGISIVQITGSSRLKEGTIEFPVEIDAGAPFVAEKTELSAVLESPASAGADLLLILDTATARNDRKIAAPRLVTSKYLESVMTIPNPNYPLAEAVLRQAQMDLQSVRQRAAYSLNVCQGFGCVIAAVTARKAVDGAFDNVRQAFESMRNTPMTMEKPVYAPYQFRETAIEAAKMAAVNYYVVDRVARSYVRGTFDTREAKSFSVCYGLRDDDPDKSQYLAGADSEADVVRFEQKPIMVPLSKILDEAGRHQAQAMPVPPMAGLRSDILADRNRMLPAAKAKVYAVAPSRQDPRFDSVVVVNMPGGSSGSGFFVKDDLVLTNYHVVGNGKFVEMVLHDGSETFGKVVGQDVRLDLALVKVQARGIPVKIYAEKNLDLGAPVEVIGHPSGLWFSITRGVVSGLREIASKYAPGGRKVRFIQTDASINPGNSGGPVFLGDKVVGVSDQKLVALELSGLSFAIHYAEVIEFLEANGLRIEK